MELIKDLERLGCEVGQENGRVRVKGGHFLPDSLKADLIEQKEEIISALARDKQAKAAGFMIGVTGEVYTRSINKHSLVFLEQIGDKWETWRETYQKNRTQAISVKVIASGSTFQYVLLKAKGYFDYMERKQRGR